MNKYIYKLGLKNRRSKLFFEKTNEIVEKYSKIAIFSINNVVIPCFIIPKSIASLFKYFITDFGKDAFDLALPMW